jgi:Cd(II)/Pb(II)-responsive transcriptional regulator
MRIGELARRAESKAETVRYYERLGLLPEPERSEGNYRIYGDAHLERLQFIRNCRAVGISLEEIRRLLHFRDRPELACHAIDELLDTHIARLEVQIDELRGLQGRLRALRTRCETPRTAGDCGILAGLASSGQDSASGASPRGAIPDGRPR